MSVAVPLLESASYLYAAYPISRFNMLYESLNARVINLSVLWLNRSKGCTAVSTISKKRAITRVLSVRSSFHPNSPQTYTSQSPETVQCSIQILYYMVLELILLFYGFRDFTMVYNIHILII